MEDNIHLCNFQVIYRHGLPRRTFDKWSLGYHIVNHDDLSELEEFKDLDKKEFYEKLHKSLEIYSNELLLHFYNKKVNEGETGTENTELY